MPVTRPSVVTDLRHALAELDRDPVPLGEHRLHPLPHLAGAEAGVAELLDQRRHVGALEPDDRQERRPEREVLDPLGRPQRADLRARDAPDLLGVRAEERVVEPARRTAR